MTNKIAVIGLAAFVTLIVGTFTVLTLVNVPVKQTQIVKIIPNERFYKKD